MLRPLLPAGLSLCTFLGPPRVLALFSLSLCQGPQLSQHFFFFAFAFLKLSEEVFSCVELSTWAVQDVTTGVTLSWSAIWSLSLLGVELSASKNGTPLPP